MTGVRVGRIATPSAASTSLRLQTLVPQVRAGLLIQALLEVGRRRMELGSCPAGRSRPSPVAM
jgi:hypothetical protein